MSVLPLDGADLRDQASDQRFCTPSAESLSDRRAATLIAADRYRSCDDPRELIAWAAESFGDGFVITSSMGDSVLSHLASSVAPGIQVLFLDTGYHFDATLLTRDAVSASLPVRVLTAAPTLTVAEQDARYGERLHDRDPDACCRMRKIEPLRRALAGYTAWASGIRRDEAVTRRTVDPVEWDVRRQMAKVNPLALWSEQRVDAYVAEHDVIVNPLVELGFASIGCEPCTSPVAAGDDPRAGRWSGTGKTECGLHL